MGQHLGRARIDRQTFTEASAYSAGWKKFEPAWDFVIRLKQLSQMRRCSKPGAGRGQAGG
jgi:hypothetical protein